MVYHILTLDVCSAKARLSKKAKTSGHADEVDSEKSPEDEGENPETATDHSTPENPGADANPPEAEPEIQADTSTPDATLQIQLLIRQPLLPGRRALLPKRQALLRRISTHQAPPRMMTLLLLARHIPPQEMQLFYPSIPPRMNLRL